MIKAFARLGLITAASLIVIIFALFSVRQLGEMQVFSEPNHPWFKQRNWSIYTPELVDLCSEKFKSGPGWLVQLPIKYVNDEWTVMCPGKPRLLKEYLSSSTHTNWLLKPEANDTTYLDRLVETVSSFDKHKRFAVLSHSQSVARYLRKKAPQWLYAADNASLVRFQMFESLWVETAMDFWPDFVITSQSGDSELTERSAKELERRHKRIVWDANNSSIQPDYPVQGIMTTRPSEIERFELPK
jgi:hypothetical protein